MEVDNAQDEEESLGGLEEWLMYDSDSSEKEQCSANRFPDMSLPPTELPFPVSSLPIGIGGHERSVLYDCLKPEESKKIEMNHLLWTCRRTLPWYLHL